MLQTIKNWWKQDFTPRGEAVVVILMLLLVVRMIANAVMNHFYDSGSLSDTYSFSALAWRNDWTLEQCKALGGGSFFIVHISWFFWIPSLISYFVEMDRIPFFSLFHGTLHALLALGVWVLLKELWQGRRWWEVFARAFIAFAFAFNANSQSMLGQAHQEIAGPAFTLLFLWAHFNKRPGVALVSFILALSQREDMGFHIFGALFLMLLLDWIRRVPRSAWQGIAIYAATAFVYSIAVLVLKHFIIGDGGIFKDHYVGAMPFMHVTENLLWERVENLVLNRHWILGPGIVALLWAAAARNPYIVSGWFAFVPWLLISVLAKIDIAGNLDLHYAYPFVIAGAWPLLAVSKAFCEPRRLAPGNPKMIGAFAAALLLIQQPISIYPWFQLKHRWFNFTLQPATQAVHSFSEFERRLPMALPILGEVRADMAAFGIAPYTFDLYVHTFKTEWWSPTRQTWEKIDEPETGVDTVFYFTEAYQEAAVKALIKANTLDNHYRIPGTRLFVSTRLKLSDMPEFRGLFVPADAPREAL
jgi:hypothetical protein